MDLAQPVRRVLSALSLALQINAIARSRAAGGHAATSAELKKSATSSARPVGWLIETLSSSGAPSRTASGRRRGALIKAL